MHTFPVSLQQQDQHHHQQLLVTYASRGINTTLVVHIISKPCLLPPLIHPHSNFFPNALSFISPLFSPNLPIFCSFVPLYSFLPPVTTLSLGNSLSNPILGMGETSSRRKYVPRHHTSDPPRDFLHSVRTSRYGCRCPVRSNDIQIIWPRVSQPHKQIIANAEDNASSNRFRVLWIQYVHTAMCNTEHKQYAWQPISISQQASANVSSLQI